MRPFVKLSRTRALEPDHRHPGRLRGGRGELRNVTQGHPMAMTNAERQSRYRDRMTEKLASARFVLEAAAEGDPALQIVKLKQDLAAEKEKVKKKEEQRAGQESIANLAERQMESATNRAMFAEADKERLQAEIDRLTEENERLRAEPLCNDQPKDDLVDMMDAAFDGGYRRAMLETIERCDNKGAFDETDPWYSWRQVLMSLFDREMPRNGIPFYLELIEMRGAKLGERHTLEARYKSLLEKKEDRDSAQDENGTAQSKPRRQRAA